MGAKRTAPTAEAREQRKRLAALIKQAEAEAAAEAALEGTEAAVQASMAVPTSSALIISQVLTVKARRKEERRQQAATKVEAVARGRLARKKMCLVRGQTAQMRALTFAMPTLSRTEASGTAGKRHPLLTWLGALPTIEYPSLVLTQLRMLRKMSVARMRSNDDATRLLREGDYYVGIACDGPSQGRLLLRAWDLRGHPTFGDAWASADGGTLLVTHDMMAACGVDVRDAASAQAFYEALYPDESGDSSKAAGPLYPDAVICHVVEVVAHLSKPDEAVKVTKSHAPRPRTVSQGQATTASVARPSLAQRRARRAQAQLQKQTLTAGGRLRLGLHDPARAYA